MPYLNLVTLLSGGVTLALALGLLIVILWCDVRKELNQSFATFLFVLTLWSAGALLAQGIALVDAGSPLVRLAIGVMELGFTGSSIAVYAMTTVLVGVHGRRFRLFAFASLLIVLGYQLFLIVTNEVSTLQSGSAAGTGVLTLRFQPVSALFYLVFDGITLYFLVRYHRKIRSRVMIFGILVFVIAQSLALLNPRLQVLTLATVVGSIAALIISFAILQQEIVIPLAERVSQVEALHRVSLAISSHISLDTVLNQIAVQAVGWLNADAAGIFLSEDRELELATAYGLPQQFLHTRIKVGEGVAGTVARTRQSIRLDTYRRDWQGALDLPLARETFGSVICVPLIYTSEATGVLMVIAGRQGRLFEQEDVRLLELLGAQAAVAIAHSRLFAEQHLLTNEVDAARSQLETVLTSTENPVIAVDRRFRLIFANPAARRLFTIAENARGARLARLLPASAFPVDYRRALRELRTSGALVYEMVFGDKVYLCHLAEMGQSSVSGWVAVLNDVTQLKELDRLKSEMVRMTSHDLKNPLQAAMANLELLHDDLSDDRSNSVQESLTTIEKQLQRMNRIISGILDLERVEAGIPALEICLPSHIVENVVEELRQLAEEQQVGLNVYVNPGVPTFRGNPEQFERALTNLVENAIKFTRAGGAVVVRARAGEKSVVFEVQDTGVGIPDALQSRVFDRFFRGRQPGVEHVSGSGLGLSLVKAVVENHGGKLWLDSQYGVGSTFFVELPAIAETGLKEDA